MYMACSLFVSEGLIINGCTDKSSVQPPVGRAPPDARLGWLLNF